MKRSKIFISTAACILCLGLLVFGVYSAVQVSFNLGGTLSFNPEGVYVDIAGQVLRGADYSNLNELEEPEYSYYGKNYTNSSGSPSGNFTMDEWNPSVIFLPTQKVIQYRLEITNNSSEPISVIPSGYQEIANIDAWESASEILKIEAGQTGTYELNLEYTGTAASQNVTFDISFNIQTTSALVAAQTGVTITQSDGVISAVTGTNTSNPDILVVPKTVDGQNITSVIDNNVTTATFKNITAKYIIFEANITDLGDWALYGCKSVVGVALPKSLERIGTSAFYQSGLSSISFPESITNIENYVFADTQLRTVTLPTKITTLSNHLFYMCSRLEEIIMPDGIESIGTSTISSCPELKYMPIPTSVLEIDSNYNIPNLTLKENGVTYLKNISEQETNNYYAVLDVETSLSTVNINNACKIIAGYAFDGCSNLSQITIPDSIVGLSANAFKNCTGISSITIPRNVKFIGQDAFVGCSGLATAVFEDPNNWKTYAGGVLVIMPSGSLSNQTSAARVLTTLSGTFLIKA